MNNCEKEKRNKRRRIKERQKCFKKREGNYKEY